MSRLGAVVGVFLCSGWVGQAHAQTLAAGLPLLRSDSQAGAGVDTGTGAFETARATLSVTGVRVVDFPITYNSVLAGGAGMLGSVWTTPYDAWVEGGPTGTVTVHWDMQRANQFRFVANNQPYEPLDEAVRYDQLTRSTSQWRVVRMDGTQYEFNLQGRLTRIGNKVSQYITVERDAGNRVTGLVDTAGKRLTLTQETGSTARVRSVSDAAGRLVYFEYDGSGRLVKVNNPATLETPIGGTFAPKTIPDTGGPFTGPARLIHTIAVTRTAPIGLVRLFQANVSHSSLAALRVSMVSPRGTTVVVGGGRQNSATNVDYTDVVLDGFNGEDPQGEWQIVFEDTQPGDGRAGTLNGWQMAFSEPTGVTRFSYSGTRLIEITAPDGIRAAAMQYDGAGRVTAQDDGLETNQVATFAYANVAGGQETTYRDRLGNAWKYVHDAGLHLTSVTDPLERTTRYVYNANGERTRVVDAAGNATAFQYNLSGDIISVVDALQNVSTLTYDSNHNLTNFRDALGNASQFTYNGNNLTAVQDALGSRDTKTYNGNSQMAGNLLADGAGINMGFSSGMRTSTGHPVSGTARTQYDAIGRVTRQTSADGIVTEYEYDSEGRVVVQKDSLGRVSRTSYDVRGRLFSATDPRGNSTFYYYDGNDNVVLVRDALGNEAANQFDGEDRLTAQTLPGNKRTGYQYDAAGQMVAETDGEGNTTRFQYDVVGNAVAIVDASGGVTRRTYDAIGNLLMETDEATQQTFSYDALGQLAVQTEATGAETRFSYDELGRPEAVRDPLARTVSNEYERDDVISGIRNGANVQTVLSYDAANRLRSVTTPEQRRTQFAYNSNDQLTREDTPGGTRFEYTYDQAGRVVALRYNAAGRIVYDYDDAGNLRRVADETGCNVCPNPVITRQFDELNRPVRFVDPSGASVQYAYTPSGKIASLQYSGKRVNYTYDEADRLVRVSDWAARQTNYTYDSRGLVSRITLPTGARREYQYNAAGQVTSLRDTTRAGAVVVEYRFLYDKAGRLISRASFGTETAAAVQVASMTYDRDNRLRSLNGAQVGADADGNMTSGPLGNGVGTLTYTRATRLATAGPATYEYDPEDRLTAFTGPGGTTRLLNDPAGGMSRILASRSPAGVETLYVYGLGLLYEERGGQVIVHHYDHIGNTIALSNAAGAITGRVAYTPYGQITSREGATDTLFLFGGQLGVLTDANGLAYMRHRWYSSQARRFLTEDPRLGDIANFASLNRFIYGNDNPVMLVDPNGDFGFIGALISVGVQLVVRGVSRAAQGRPFVEKGEEWAFVGELAGAALAGGLTGGASSIIGGAARAAGAAAVGNLVKQGISNIGNAVAGRRAEFSAEDLGTDVALSAAFGAIPAGRGIRGVRPAKSVQAANKALYRRVQVNAKTAAAARAQVSRVKTIPVPVDERSGKEIARDIGLEVVQSGISYAINGDPATSQPGAPLEAEPDLRLTRAAARQEVYKGRRSKYGEFMHYEFYVNAMELAARPLPNNPNPRLAAF